MSLGGGSSDSKSSVQWYPGQKDALGGVFGPGGIFDQFQQGKPNAGYERQQAVGLQQLQRTQAANGTLNTPLGTRAQSDYLQKSTSAAGDEWMKTLFAFLQPAGQSSKSHAFNFSV